MLCLAILSNNNNALSITSPSNNSKSLYLSKESSNSKTNQEVNNYLVKRITSVKRPNRATQAIINFLDLPNLSNNILYIDKYNYYNYADSLLIKVKQSTALLPSPAAYLDLLLPSLIQPSKLEGLIACLLSNLIYNSNYKILVC